MSDYYFDIETYSKTPKPDLNNDEIIAITYQHIDSRTGEIKDGLNILKSWELSEKGILKRFIELYNPSDRWSFIPIGFNLSGFDFISLIYRLKKYGIEVRATQFFDHPYIDMQHVLFLCNKGSFKGCNLDKFAGKESLGSVVLEKYDQKDYSVIEEYIKNEAEKFIKLYQFLVNRLPEVWLEYANLNNLQT
ncbi:MAG: hypothetical protein ABR954_06710 [Dehalococcoidales bacterium]